MTARRAALLFTFLAAAGPARAADRAPLRVLAAASLSDAFRDLGRAFEAALPGRRVELGFAGTQVLRTQVEQGAAADVFASADVDHAEALRKQGLVHSFEPFAHSALVVVTPSEGARVRSLADLARPGLRVVAASPAVPAGAYTAELLARLAADPAFGAAFAARVQKNVVSRETNVRLVLSKVVLGEADAGVVYETDAASARDKVRTVPLPPSLEVVATYTIGVLTSAIDAEAARLFVAFVRGPEGRAILARHGFRP